MDGVQGPQRYEARRDDDAHAATGQGTAHRHTIELAIKSDAAQNNVAWSAGDKSGQDTEASGHWWVRYGTSADPGTYAVSMDAQTGDYGTFITCTITEGGKVVASNTSTGPYASVQCSA